MVTGCDLLLGSGTTAMTNAQWAALHLGGAGVPVSIEIDQRFADTDMLAAIGWRYPPPP